MKHLLLIALTLTAAVVAFADEPRDLTKKPLTSIEWKAYRASKSFAEELGEKTHPSCVNEFKFDEGTSVTVQFYEPQTDDTLADCNDPHHSIEVAFDVDGNLTGISLTDI